jgi:hypothetical protein
MFEASAQRKQREDSGMNGKSGAERSGSKCALTPNFDKNVL